MVPHAHIGKQNNVIYLKRDGELFEESGYILFIGENTSPLISSASYMIICTRILDP